MYLWSTTFEFFYRILTKLLDFYSFYSRELREGCKGAAGKSQLSFFSPSREAAAFIPPTYCLFAPLP